MATEHVPPISSTSSAAPSAPLPHPVRLLRFDGSARRRRPLPCGGAVFEKVGRPTANGVTWVWARADLDLATVVRARRELSRLVAPGHNPGNVLVYLGPDRFVDLRGLRLLVETARRVRAGGGALAVVAPPRSLRQLVQLAQVDAELPLVASARQATWWARTRGSGLL